MRRAQRSVLRLSEYRGGARKKGHSYHAAVFGKTTLGSARGGCAGRSVRYRPAHSNLLCDLDARTRTRARSHPSLYRGTGLTLPTRLKATFHEKIWGSTELEPWFPRSQKKIGEVWFTGETRLPV